MNSDPTIVAKLDELMAAIKSFPDPRRAGEEWKQAYRLLTKAGLPSGVLNGVVGMRNVAKLAELIEQVRVPESAPPPENAPDAETCRQALHAFRKRLSLTILDEQSKLGHSPLSKGDARASTAMMPPAEWPQEVWQELVRQGRLRYIGHGLYEIVKQ